MQAGRFYAGYKKHVDPNLTNTELKEEVEEEAASLDEGDIRHLLIAEKTVVIRDTYFKFAPRKGCEPQMRVYKALHPLTYMFQGLLMLYIFFSPPSWCEKLGDEIDSNCLFKDDGVKIIRSPLPVFRTVIFTIGCPLALIFLTAMRTWKYRLIRRNYSEMSVCIFLIFDIAAWFFITMVWPKFQLGDIPMSDLLVVLFLVAQIDEIRQCTIRMMAISVTGFEVIAVYLFLVIAYACLNRILLYTYPVKDTQDSEHVW